MPFTPLNTQKDTSSFTPLGGAAPKYSDIIAQHTAPAGPSLGSDLLTGVKKDALNIKDTFNGNTPESKGEPTPVLALQTVAAGFHGINDAIGTVAKHAYDAIPDDVKKDALNNAESVLPGGQLLSHVLGSIIPKEIDIASHKAKEVATSAPVQNTTKAIVAWQNAHPEAAKTLNSVLKGVGALAYSTGSTAALAEGGGEASDLLDGTGILDAKPADIIDKTKSFFSPSAEETAAAGAQDAVDAVNPDLSGKKLAGAYKETVTGDRSVQGGGLFKEQTLSPSQKAINLGTRLSSDVPLKTVLENGNPDTIPAITLGKDHIANLQNLGDALDTTETKLGEALKGDPEINRNADKPTLQAALNDIKTNAPQEFATNIKDNSNVYNKVVNYGQKLINEGEDTVAGIRDARTAFDTQAKREFPSAFKDGGFIDTKTPAGAAIKSVRDTINEHLYNTAPNGSDIRALIGREADIFNAADAIAPKAAATHGSNILERLATKYPKAAKLVKIGVPAIVGDKILKAATGLGI